MKLLVKKFEIVKEYDEDYKGRKIKYVEIKFEGDEKVYPMTKSFYDKYGKKYEFAKGGTIRKGDYVRDARGELGLVNKVKKGVAYVKYPSTNPNAFEPVFLHEIKETKDMHKGRKVYTDFYDK